MSNFVPIPKGVRSKKGSCQKYWPVFVRSPSVIWAPGSYDRVAILWFRQKLCPRPLVTLGHKKHLCRHLCTRISCSWRIRFSGGQPETQKFKSSIYLIKQLFVWTLKWLHLVKTTVTSLQQRCVPTSWGRVRGEVQVPNQADFTEIGQNGNIFVFWSFSHARILAQSKSNSSPFSLNQLDSVPEPQPLPQLLGTHATKKRCAFIPSFPPNSKCQAEMSRPFWSCADRNPKLGFLCSDFVLCRI